MIRLLFLVFFTLFVIGCGSSSDNFSANAGQSDQTVQEGSIEGFLVQSSASNRQFHGQAIGSTVVSTVGGSSPIAGGMVVAKNTSGIVVGMSLTGPSGFFKIDGAPTGAITLELRNQPVQPVSGTVNVTALKGVATTVNASFQVSREEAIELARPFFGEEALVSGTLSPLSPKTTVSTLKTSVNRITEGNEWLFLVNPSPLLKYSHPVTFVFVDADTGAVVATESEFFPRVNGESLWEGIDDLFDFGNVVPPPPGTIPVPRAEVVQIPPELANILSLRIQGSPEPDVRLQANNATAESIFVLIVVGSPDFTLKIDAKNMEKFFTDGGVPKSNIEVVFGGKITNTKIAQFAANSTLELAIDTLAAKIDTRASKKLDSTFIYYHTSHGDSTGRDPQGKNPEGVPVVYFGEADLDAISIVGPSKSVLGDVVSFDILEKTNSACRQRVLIDACESGNIGFDLEKRLQFLGGKKGVLPNRFPQNVIIYTASKLNQLTAYIPPEGKFVGLKPGSLFTSTVTEQGFLENGDLVGLARNTEINATGTPTIIGDLVELISPIRRDAQNAQVFTFDGNPELCAIEAGTAVEKEVPSEKPTKVSFVNETSDTATVKIQAENQTVNGGNPIELAPAGEKGDRFEEVLPGAVKSMTVTDFDTPLGKVDNIGVEYDLPQGTQQTFFWRNAQGSRTLTVGPVNLLESSQPTE